MKLLIAPTDACRKLVGGAGTLKAPKIEWTMGTAIGLLKDLYSQGKTATEIGARIRVRAVSIARLRTMTQRKVVLDIYTVLTMIQNYFFRRRLLSRRNSVPSLSYEVTDPADRCLNQRAQVECGGDDPEIGTASLSNNGRLLWGSKFYRQRENVMKGISVLMAVVGAMSAPSSMAIQRRG